MSLEACIVAILNEADNPVGTGVLLEKQRVLTCAHVVNAALGRAKSQTGPPAETTVRIRLHGTKTPLTAAIDHATWTDPPAHRAFGADLCVLQLTGGPFPKTSPAHLCMFGDLVGRSFRAGGYPAGWDVDYQKGTVEGEDEHGLWLLRPSEPVFAAIATFLGKHAPNAGLIREGFSGGPVEIERRIAGLVAAVRANASDATAYMIPVRHFPVDLRTSAELYENVVMERYPHVHEMSKRLAESTMQTAGPSAEFDIRVRLCKSFADVLEANKGGKAGQPLPGKRVEGYGARDLTPADLAHRLAIGRDEDGADLTRILLHAPGGAGKSSFLHRLLTVASAENLVPFYLDFSRMGDESTGKEQGAKALLEDWFARFAGKGAPGDLLDLAQGRGGRDLKPLLVIDGFNQAKRNWREELEKIADLSIRELAGAAIVIADRLVDRAAGNSFRLAVVPPLPQSAYAAALEDLAPGDIVDNHDWSPILSSPLFLNIVREIVRSQPASETRVTPSRFSVLNQYFRDVCSFTVEELFVLAETAYQVYSRFGRTNIRRAEFEKLLERQQDMALRAIADLSSDPKRSGVGLGPDLAALRGKIDTHGLLNDLGEDAVEFRHQILHDWLVALKVASCADGEEEKILRAPAFDTLSLSAASADGVELAVEALQDPTQLLVNVATTSGAVPTGGRAREASWSPLLGDRKQPLTVGRFLTELYDWNSWITLECVMSFDKRILPSAPIVGWMRHAFYALNLEKLFDVFLHTALRTERLRDEVTRSLTLPYADSQSHAEFFGRVVETLTGLGAQNHGEAKPELVDEDGMRWIELYTRTTLQPPDFDRIWGDPLLGWTVANVIKRAGLGTESAQDLMRLYRVSKSTSDSAGRAASFRWRIVHALGRAPANTASDFLLGVTFDVLEERHVRYGAIRSALEVAALSDTPDAISRVLQFLDDHLEELFQYSVAWYVHPSIRQQLRRACALNDNCAYLTSACRGQWLTTALPQYQQILEKGARLTEEMGVPNEAALWREWEQAVRDVRAMDIDDAARRRQRFAEAITKDQG